MQPIQFDLPQVPGVGVLPEDEDPIEKALRDAEAQAQQRAIENAEAEAQRRAKAVAGPTPAGRFFQENIDVAAPVFNAVGPGQAMRAAGGVSEAATPKGLNELFSAAYDETARITGYGPDLVMKGVQIAGGLIGEGLRRAAGEEPNPDLPAQIERVFNQQPAYFSDAFRKAFEQIGLTDPDAATDTFMARMGKNLPFALAALVGGYSAVPAMSRTVGPGVADGIASTGKYLQKSLLDFLVGSPGRAVTSEVAAVAGQTLGEDIGRTMGSEAAGGFLGALTGGWGGTTVGAAISRGVKSLGTRLGAFLRGEVSGVKPKPEELAPLRNPEVDPRDVTNIAARRVEDLTAEAEQEMRDAIAAVPRKGSQIDANARVRSVIQAHHDKWRKAESEAWDAVGNPKIPISGAQKRMRTLLGHMLRERGMYERWLEAQKEGLPFEYPPDVPGEQMLKFIANPDKKLGAVPLKQLQSFREDIRSLRIGEAVKPNARGTLVRNYNQIYDIVTKAINRAKPGGSDAWKKATQLTRNLHDIYDRTVLADLTLQNKAGKLSVPPEETFTGSPFNTSGYPGLTHKTQGVSAAIRASRELGPNELRELTGEAEQAVRDTFREFAEATGDEQLVSRAISFITRETHGVRRLQDVYTELRALGANLRATQERQKEIGKSILAKYGKGDAASATRALISSDNTGRDARLLMTELGGDPQAISSVKAGLVDRLFEVGGNSAESLAKHFRDPKWRDALTTILSPDEYKRLAKIVNWSERLAKGDRKMLARQMNFMLPIVSRMVGVRVGHAISKMTGGGTIQMPAIVSGVFARAADRVLASTPPAAFARMAVLDPDWERLMFSRLPSNTREYRKFTSYLQRALATVTGGGNMIIDTGESDD